MAQPLALSIHDAFVTFGGKPIFEGLSINIHQGDKIALVGKNGAGKTTLMHMITGERELDSGKRWEEPGVTIGYLQQDVAFNPEHSVEQFVFSGLKKENQTDENAFMVEMVVKPLDLSSDAKMGTLSGGQLRRAALAQSLIEHPDILMLDEPTNHLDLTATLWLEDYLKSYRGTLLCVSHDKTFLANISNKIFWLDRGNVRVCPKGFRHFDEWSEMLLDQEARELHKREKILEGELEWANKGVKARRKRNVRRVEEIKKARAKLLMDQSSFRKTMQKIELEPIDNEEESSKIVAEFFKVGFKYQSEGREKLILDKLNLRIMRGDRIGILGKNGSGKTTFLKLLLGDLEPDSGKVKLAKNVEIAYFDQKRSDLKANKTLWNTLCPTGGDYVDVMGKQRHVCGYLKDFMFDPKGARDLVGTLSGGQQNRLLLAKVLAKPGSLMILDEPTNDLDMDTLEILEETLSKYNGTLFVVSHDRDFLDQTVTKILAFEGDGVVDGYIGGYSDYLEEKAKRQPGYVAPKEPEIVEIKPEKSKQISSKLSYKLQYEWETLPDKIAKLEKEIKDLHHILADPNLYMQNPEEFDRTSRRMAKAENELEIAELRWLELDEMRGSGN